MTGVGPVYVYDGSFAGWLTVVFEAYRRREPPGQIVTEAPEVQGALFSEALPVATDAEAAERVRRGLERRVRPGGVERVYHAFLSEAPGIERDLYRLAARVFTRDGSALDDLRFPPALLTERMAARVRHEVHRMHAFVRFERRAGERYVAVARPEHNVLPLLHPHFGARYPAMRWAIVDDRRGYALLHTPAADRAEGEAAAAFVPAAAVAFDRAEDEAAFQGLWQAYYRAVTIEERRNPKLHLRHVPRRYWPYLTEKRTAAVS
ncbi:MAG: TIGR03915 family putative DNA repair protein [Rhodothermales bacterium]|nr:TIGR03915 family putative DNA repair protein [Rhodothermales bacterium]